jgi:hypothetical protein
MEDNWRMQLCAHQKNPLACHYMQPYTKADLIEKTIAISKNTTLAHVRSKFKNLYSQQNKNAVICLYSFYIRKIDTRMLNKITPYCIIG